MATYKVIQDIEAEDHILGPLSFRQFIYGLIAAFFFFLCYMSIAKHVAFLLVLFLPPALFCAFFAFPFGTEQTTEVWALAKLRFYFKPRKRIWNQSGVKELVSITVPKKIELQLTDGLSQGEVKSRLQALANTIDSRGWAVKHAVNGNVYTRPGMFDAGASERLLNIGAMPQAVPDNDEGPDILDYQASPLAQQFGSMIDSTARNHRQQLIDQMNGQTSAAQPSGQWFAPQSSQLQPVTSSQQVTTSPAAEDSLHTRLAAEARANIQRQAKPSKATTADNRPTAEQPDAAILNLAKNNDLNVATLAREAGKAKGLGDQEVVIALH